MSQTGVRTPFAARVDPGGPWGGLRRREARFERADARAWDEVQEEQRREREQYGRWVVYVDEQGLRERARSRSRSSMGFPLVELVLTVLFVAATLLPVIQWPRAVDDPASGLAWRAVFAVFAAVYGWAAARTAWPMNLTWVWPFVVMGVFCVAFFPTLLPSAEAWANTTPWGWLYVIDRGDPRSLLNMATAFGSGLLGAALGAFVLAPLTWWLGRRLRRHP